MTILCVDPGLSGGIAWRIAGGLPAVEPMPATEADICSLIESAFMSSNGERKVAYIEDVPIGMPGKGAAMSKLNANAGFIRGVLAALNIRLIMVRPQKWQQHFSLGTRASCASDSEWKNKLKQCAQRRFPDLPITLKTADALLILDYALDQERSSPAAR